MDVISLSKNRHEHVKQSGKLCTVGSFALLLSQVLRDIKFFFVFVVAVLKDVKVDFTGIRLDMRDIEVAIKSLKL